MNVYLLIHRRYYAPKGIDGEVEIMNVFADPKDAKNTMKKVANEKLEEKIIIYDEVDPYCTYSGDMFASAGVDGDYDTYEISEYKVNGGDLSADK